MTKYYQVCSCFGHSKIETTDDLREIVKATYIDLIEEKQVCIFYFGGFSEFDDLCHEIISELKNKYPYIKRIYCLSDPRHLRLSKRPRWLKNEEYEKFVYLNLDFDYWYTRLYYRNCEMINQSDYIIFYVRNTKNSGAYKALQYAEKKKKSIIKL